MKKKYLLAISLMTAFLAAHTAFTLLDLNEFSNTFSPLIALGSGVILLAVYSRATREATIFIPLLFLAFACFSWFIGDVVMAVNVFSGNDPGAYSFVWFCYAATNLFLLAALAAFVIGHFRKWHTTQLLIDIVIVGIMTLHCIVIAYFNKDFSMITAILRSDNTSIFCLSCDVLIIVILLCWGISVRSSKIPPFIKVTALGVLLFAFTDMFYYYMSYHYPHVRNPFIYVFYILSLVVIALGSLGEHYQKKYGRYRYDFSMNIGVSIRLPYLLTGPLIITVLEVTGILDTSVNFVDYIVFAVCMLLYRALSHFVQGSVQNEKQLKQDKDLLEQKINEQDETLSFIINRDTLTGLMNRRSYLLLLDDYIEKKTAPQLLANIIFDVDRFKSINDNYGHDVGDRLLILLSGRLNKLEGGCKAIARLSGDEFALLLCGDHSLNDVSSLCDKLIELCAEPFIIDEQELNITICIGVCVLTPDSDNGKAIMQNADIAMYRAKSQGYNKYQIYDPIMSTETAHTYEVELLLKKTSPTKDFELFYQPQFSLPRHELIGAEALIRWKHPAHGYIPPNVFIPIAEEIDYIHIIGEWVIEETIRQATEWNQNYKDRPLKLCFNVSPKQFLNTGFITVLQNLISKSGINPALLEAEITEGIMLNHSKQIEECFSRIKEMGISVSIDDFGSGYSSLGYLNRFNFDKIKLDKSLVDELTVREVSGVNVIKAAITMAHALGIQTIAEGVETREQLDMLTALDCDQAQGYFLGRPVPADVFAERFLRTDIPDSKIC